MVPLSRNLGVDEAGVDVNAPTEEIANVVKTRTTAHEARVLLC